MMTPSLIYRLLLPALLPVIAVVIYLRGQDYDPGLVQFQETGSGPDVMVSLFPETFEKYRRVEPVRIFTGENLYEHVNGHAEYFVAAGFKRLVVAEYVRDGSPESAPEIVGEIYDMGKGIQAFGLISDEAAGSTAEFSAGDLELRSSREISLVKGKYYIKIIAFTGGTGRDALKAAIGERIVTGTDGVSEFALFPDMGETVQTRFIKESYLGVDFLNQVLEREYRISGNSVKLALFTRDRGEIRKLTGRFLKFFEDSEIAYTQEQTQGSIIYRVKDPYEGNWALIATEDALFGMYGDFDDNTIEKVRSHDIKTP